MTTRRLIVMRHAKAEPYAAQDHDRALTDRGRAAATAAGEYLAANELVPDYALVSTAVRTVSTWQAVARACGSSAVVSVDRALYSGSVELVLETLTAVPAEARTVILVGHNPVVSYLAHLLDDGNGDRAATNEMIRGYPPGAMTVLTTEVPWSGLGPESGRVVDFHVP